MAGEAVIALLRLTGERGITPDARRGASSLLHPALCKLVACKLTEDWSPEQIAGWLKLGSPEDHTRRVSHETIHRTLFIQMRGALKRELLLHLRRAGSVRRPQVAKGQHAGQGQIRDAVSMRERPPEAEDRAVPGHWEGDLLAGAAPRGPRGRRRPPDPYSSPAPGRGSPGCGPPARRGIYCYARPIKPPVTTRARPGARLYACRRADLLGRHPTR